MIKYMLMQDEVIRSKKDGRVIKVHDFRKRTKYDQSWLIYDKIKESELIRPDLLSLRLYGNQWEIGAIIDSNEKDVFSFEINERLKYVNPSLLKI